VFFNAVTGFRPVDGTKMSTIAGTLQNPTNVLDPKVTEHAMACTIKLYNKVLHFMDRVSYNNSW
jgi:lactate dehydrogenase-like 2-hydroxyacid dehydrogenase